MKKFLVLFLAVAFVVAAPALAAVKGKANLQTVKLNDIPEGDVLNPVNAKNPAVGTELGRTSNDWVSNGNVLNQISTSSDGGVHFSWLYRNEAGAGGSREYMYNWRDPAAGTFLGATAFADRNASRWGSSECTWDGLGMGAFYDNPNYTPMFCVDGGAGFGAFNLYGIDSTYAVATYGGIPWPRLAVNRNPANSDTIYCVAQGSIDDPVFTVTYDLGANWSQWAEIGLGVGGFVPDFPEQQIAAGAAGKVAVVLNDSFGYTVYRESNDYGATWGPVTVAIDPYLGNPGGDTVVPYIHPSIFYDAANNLHIFNVAEIINGNTGPGGEWEGIVQWSSATGVTYVTKRWFTAGFQIGGTNTLNDSWPNMCQHANGKYLVTFTRFVDTDIAADGYANGDIYYTTSSDLVNWTAPYNISQTQSPGAAAGACEDDRYPDCAIFGDTLHVSFLISKDASAANASTPQGTMTYDYIWHIGIDYQTGVAGSPAVPNKHSFVLSQNRPNPVRDHTLMSFQMSKDGPYTMKIYNVVGQVVKEFKGIGTAGTNNLTWKTGSTPNGLYFYQLSANGNTATKKLVVVK